MNCISVETYSNTLKRLLLFVLTRVSKKVQLKYNNQTKGYNFNCRIVYDVSVEPFSFNHY